jgi:CBS domain-containing protein
MHLKIIPDIVRDQDIRGMSDQDTVLDAAKNMTTLNIGAIVVVDGDDNLVGIVTERDMTRRVMAAGLDPRATALGEIMTKNPDTLAPDDSALDALELMRLREYRHLPVTDDRKVVGMVSVRDLYTAVKGALEKDIQETEAFVFGDRYGA